MEELLERAGEDKTCAVPPYSRTCTMPSTWHEIVTHLRPLPRTPRRHAPRHLAPNELRQLLPRFSPKYRGVAWTMFTTGMRISEYAEENHTH